MKKQDQWMYPWDDEHGLRNHIIYVVVTLVACAVAVWIAFNDK